MAGSINRNYIPVPQAFGPMPFSMGVLVGDTFYMSGHIGFDPATKKVPADLEEEIRSLLDGFRDTLSKAGLSMQDLVYVQIFCSDVSLFDRFNAVYRTYLQEPFPARAFLGSGPLLFGAHFEIQGIAVGGKAQVSHGAKNG